MAGSSSYNMNDMNDRPLPPHDPDCVLRLGDEVVILDGEQRGLLGTVKYIERTVSGDSVVVAMQRRDGSRGVAVAHRLEYVGKLLPAVPVFTDAQQAESWMLAQLHDVPADFAEGAQVIISCPPHLASRITGLKRTKSEWLARHEDMEAPARVTKYMPRWDAGTPETHRLYQPGYEVLVMVDGEPELIEISARRVLRLA